MAARCRGSASDSSRRLRFCCEDAAASDGGGGRVYSLFRGDARLLRLEMGPWSEMRITPHDATTDSDVIATLVSDTCTLTLELNGTTKALGVCLQAWESWAPIGQEHAEAPFLESRWEFMTTYRDRTALRNFLISVHTYLATAFGDDDDGDGDEAPTAAVGVAGGEAVTAAAAIAATANGV